MAILFDVATAGTVGSLAAATSQTISHTCTGTNLILLVGTTCSNTTDANRNITGVTYGGVALTQIREDNDDTGNITTELWYLLNPATGANNIVISYTGTGNTVTNAGASFTGVSQSSPIDAKTGAGGTGTTASVNITTTVPNAYQIAVVAEASNRPVTTAGGQTEMWNGGTSPVGAGGYQAVAAIGTVTPAFTWTVSSVAWLISAVVIRPATPGASFQPNRLRPAIFKPGLAR